MYVQPWLFVYSNSKKNRLFCPPAGANSSLSGTYLTTLPTLPTLPSLPTYSAYLLPSLPTYSLYLPAHTPTLPTYLLTYLSTYLKMNQKKSTRSVPCLWIIYNQMFLSLCGGNQTFSNSGVCVAPDKATSVCVCVCTCRLEAVRGCAWI